MSDSVRPHRRQPNRLHRPWDFPGKNTGVGCHFLQVKSFSRVRLPATPWTAAHQAPLPMRFSRQEYWSGLPLGTTTRVIVQKVMQVKGYDAGNFSCFCVIGQAYVSCAEALGESWQCEKIRGFQQGIGFLCYSFSILIIKNIFLSLTPLSLTQSFKWILKWEGSSKSRLIKW